MNDPAGDFAAVAVALYVAHHVGDYWIQTGHQAKHKGDPGRDGRIACLNHVATYVAGQALFLLAPVYLLGADVSSLGVFAALAVSGVTHYAADRREHGLMSKLARAIPGKANFMRLGVPRDPRVIEAWFDCARCEGLGVAPDGVCTDCRGGGKLPSALTITDNPSLGTGAWALDQSWHIFWGVFVAGLLAVVL